MHIRIGTRASELARIQAQIVGKALIDLGRGITVEYVLKKAEGDRDTSTPLWQLPDKGVFTRDLTDLLIKGAIDIAVHSWKDLPLLDEAQTAVVGTLPRADARDVLLIRKDRWQRVAATRKLIVMSSSPRRAYNLGEFLRWALPAEIRDLQFVSVRGNVQTRLRKLLEGDADGIVVAKAALDRLIEAQSEEFSEAREFVRKALGVTYWMITPLSHNPNAAAQGALAIEASKGRKDLIELLGLFNAEGTMAAVEHERRVLQSYGGGCHQKIGMAVLERPYGRVIFLRGETNEGEKLDRRILEFNGPRPPKTSAANIWPSDESDPGFFEPERLVNLPAPSEEHCYWVAKASAVPDEWRVPFEAVVWAAGETTWRKLAERGIWVNGSAEGLGEEEKPALSTFVSDERPWIKLTHDAAPGTDQMALLPTYTLRPRRKIPLLSGKTHFFWKSGSQFSEALKHYPEIKDGWHSCGPGNTWKKLREIAGPKGRISVYLDQQAWLADVIG